jgi:ABC-type phosphate/phosphonate transport system permease subunit
MEKKRQRTRTATIFTMVGTGLLGGAGYNFTITGRELIAIYMAVLAVIVLGVGISQFGKASRSG